jgi:hypothetical protein
MRHLLPSPAMAVALVALGIALGGSAVAGTGLITGAQIKDHSIGYADLSSYAVAKLHGLRGPAGPQGLAGADGAPGPAGPGGPAGTFSTANLQFATSGPQNANAGTVDTATANCPAGTRVVSGGGSSTTGYLFFSGPSSATAWTAGNVAYSGVSGTITAYALCG